MKKFLLLVLVILLCAVVCSFNEAFTTVSGNKADSIASTKTDSKIYTNGILTSLYNTNNNISNYDINVELNPRKKIITAYEEITWINRTDQAANEIQLHFYPNSLKNRNTEFVKGRSIHLDEETKSSINVKEIKVDNKPAQLIYFQPEVKNPYDSTAAKINLSKAIQPGDSVKIVISYSMRIPKAMRRLGYAAGRNFFFISQWFPKVGVFNNGKWICSQYHPYTNFFSDFGKYKVNITVPKDYTVASTGVITNSSVSENKKTLSFIQDGVHDFAWMASDKIIKLTTVYKRKDNTEVKINLFIQPENEKYIERYKNAVINTLKYLEYNIGVYPYETFSMVDVPKSSNSGGMEYPTLVTVQAGLFSPPELSDVEDITIHETIHQYFYGMIANNEVYEAWLDEGLTNYLTGKILQKYYGPKHVSFNLFGYYPVLGINFLSYNEIPLLYTLGDFYYNEGELALAGYYSSPNISAISDTSYLNPDFSSYAAASYDKPELMLITMERHLGTNKMNNILRDYFNQYSFKHPSANEFFSVVQKNSEENIDWLINNIYHGTSVFDYKIRYVAPTDDRGNYEVFVERRGDGICKQELAFYTDKDTQLVKWDGKERWHKFRFFTKNEVKGAEVDPYEKNILDLNFANNSYLVHRQYAGSLSISVKWFFWIQNLLVILGSIA